MGLGVNVGVLVGGDDAEYGKDFEKINQVLRFLNLPEHEEPTDLKGAEPFSEDISEINLGLLRRVAICLSTGRGLPPPGDPWARDPISEEFYSSLKFGEGLFFPKLPGKAPGTDIGFDHLLIHSDEVGYCIPVRFEQAIWANPEMEIPGNTIGSSPILLEECRVLAEALALPLDTDPLVIEDEEDTQGEGDARWKRYACESSTCLTLYEAAKLSVETGAAIFWA